MSSKWAGPPEYVPTSMLRDCERELHHSEVRIAKAREILKDVVVKSSWVNRVVVESNWVNREIEAALSALEGK